MLVGVDANISPRVARALQELNPDHDFRGVGAGPATSDAPWISAFAEAKGDGLITLDKKVFSRPNEVKALYESELLTCIFNFGRITDFRVQSAVIIEYWQYIEELWSKSDPPKVIRAQPAKSRTIPNFELLEYWLDNDKPRVRASKI
ncbi:MAG: hypothetical protein AAF583_01115 [Pseudomonadota bacterium]